MLLKSEGDFDKGKFKKSVNSVFFRMRYASNQNSSRFGFIIPKKIMSKVVDRNKVKRRLKSILAENLPHIRNADVIYFPNQKALTSNYQALKTEVEKLLKQAALWKE